MDNETLFYIFGGIAAVSAVVVTFAGLKLKNFPGRMLPLVVVWFAAFAVAASTFSVLQAKDHEAHEAAHEKTEHSAEDSSSGPYENEGGALGGEREELEEEAEKEAEGPEEEEPVGPVEGPQESGQNPQDDGEGKESSQQGGDSGAEASETTLQLAADETAIAFDKTELSAEPGKVTIDFTNPSAIPHNVVILEGDKELAGFEPIIEGEESVSADLEAGEYEFICSVPGHPEAGMKGTLTVE
jgi:plastocyanin